MKIFFLGFYLVIVIVVAFYIGHEERLTKVQDPILKEKQKEFLKIDIKDDNLDLDQAIKNIKEVRKTYPLDDKLKMVDMELEHRKANENH